MIGVLRVGMRARKKLYYRVFRCVSSDVLLRETWRICVGCGYPPAAAPSQTPRVFFVSRAADRSAGAASIWCEGLKKTSEPGSLPRT